MSTTAKRATSFASGKAGSPDSISRAPAAEKINDRGQIGGSYSETAAFVKDPDARPRAFLLDRGRSIRIDMPVAVLTLAHGVNDRG